jgi:hypothetical protein
MTSIPRPSSDRHREALRRKAAAWTKYKEADADKPSRPNLWTKAALEQRQQQQQQQQKQQQKEVAAPKRNKRSLDESVVAKEESMAKKRMIVHVRTRKTTMEDRAELPLELWVEISAQGDWESSPGLVTCSRDLLRTFCRADVLVRMLDYLLFSKPFPRTLPRWLTLSFPVSLVAPGRSLDVKLPTEEDREKLLGRFFAPPLHRLIDLPHFLTGSLPCAVAYDAPGRLGDGICGPLFDTDRPEDTWDVRDVDVWVPRDVFPTRLSVQLVEDDSPWGVSQGSRNHIDLIPARKEGQKPHECIELFDLSVVQQGIDVLTRTNYCTPLSLYSLAKKVIVVSVADWTIEYANANPDLGQDGWSGLMHRLVQHYTECVPGAEKYASGLWKIPMKHAYGSGHFFECPKCRWECTLAKPEPQDYKYKVRRWMDRLAKYQKRFPDYAFVYFVSKEMEKTWDTPVKFTSDLFYF